MIVLNMYNIKLTSYDLVWNFTKFGRIKWFWSYDCSACAMVELSGCNNSMIIKMVWF